MAEIDFPPAAPWPCPAREDCYFYTCMDLPDGETIEGANWDIRGRFPAYIGGHDVAGKTVLDVGTASGFLAFAAEDAGAAHVTAVEARQAAEFRRVPFAGSAYTDDRRNWINGSEAFLNSLKRGFWYSWHRKRSKVDMIYAPAGMLWRLDRRFDVVIAGAIVEHLSDPVPFLSNLAALAEEAVIVAFTPVGPSEALEMTTMNDWDDPVRNYGWWALSIGLYRRIFANLGFSVELTSAQAICNEYGAPKLETRPTLIARRIR